MIPSVPLLFAANLSGRPGVRHGFTTRDGGVSRGALSSLNLGRRPDETAAALRANWDRVAATLEPRLGADDVALLSQVHGATVLRADAPTGPDAVLGEADAAITVRPGVVLAVRVADCVPVLIASPGGVAVAHAGWRGTAAGVVAATVRALAAATGDAPGAMTAAVGPHIGGDAYEVGDEVVGALRAAGLADADFLHPHVGPRPHVDLGRAVAAQLRAAGVTDVERVVACTRTDPRFYSHRRDGAATGRFAGVIVRTEPR